MRLTNVRQVFDWDCGLAALASVANCDWAVAMAAFIKANRTQAVKLLKHPNQKGAGVHPQHLAKTFAELGKSTATANASGFPLKDMTAACLSTGWPTENGLMFQGVAQLRDCVYDEDGEQVLEAASHYVGFNLENDRNKPAAFIYDPLGNRARCDLCLCRDCSVMALVMLSDAV